MNKVTEQALHAAEQCMTDVLTLYRNHSTSDLVFGEAMKDMKNDALKLVKLARAANKDSVNALSDALTLHQTLLLQCCPRQIEASLQHLSNMVEANMVYVP